MKYTVTATVQSPGNDPVDIRWTTKDTAIGAMVAVAQLLDEEDHPPRHGFEATLLQINVIPVPDPTPPWEG